MGLFLRHVRWRRLGDHRLHWESHVLEEPVEPAWIRDADCVLDYCAGVHGRRHLLVSEKNRVCFWS